MTAAMLHDVPSPLVSTEWLVHRLDMPRLRIIDTRKGSAYAGPHVPGAVSIGDSPYLRADGDVLGADAFAHRMSLLGIDRDTLVIAYDDGNNLFAARLWWALNYYGHPRVQVLDGGWDGWVAQRGPCTDEPHVVAPAQFPARAQPGWIARTSEVQAAVGDAGYTLLDVRGDAEWQRTEASGETPAGHIPGARHLVWTEVIDVTTGRFKTPAALRALLVARGIRPEHEIIVYCLGGIRAAHSVLALKLAGYDRVRNYEGSWAAWSRADLPIEAAAGAA